MRGLRCLCVLLIAMSAAAGGGELPASEALQWRWQLLPANARAGDEVEIVLTAQIASGYILYASDFQGSLGPRPAKVSFEPGSIEPIGPLLAVASLRRKDKTFGTEYTYFEKRAEFRQKARLLDVASIAGRIDGQTCLETDGSCELFRQPFSIAVR